MSLSREEFRKDFLKRIRSGTCVIANSDPDSYLSILLLLRYNPNLAKNINLMYNTQVLSFLKTQTSPVIILDTMISREILIRLPWGSTIVDHHIGTFSTVKPCHNVLTKKNMFVLFHPKKCTARLIFEALFFDQPSSCMVHAVDMVDRGIGLFPYSEWHICTGFATRFEEIYNTNPTGIIVLAHANFITSPLLKHVEIFRQAGSKRDVISQKVIRDVYNSGKVVVFDSVTTLLIQKPPGRRGVSLLSVKIFDKYQKINMILYWTVNIVNFTVLARYNVRARVSSGINVVKMFKKFGAVGGGHPTAASFSDKSPENIHQMWCL